MFTPAKYEIQEFFTIYLKVQNAIYFIWDGCFFDYIMLLEHV